MDMHHVSDSSSLLTAKKNNILLILAFVLALTTIFDDTFESKQREFGNSKICDIDFKLKLNPLECDHDAFDPIAIFVL